MDGSSRSLNRFQRFHHHFVAFYLYSSEKYFLKNFHPEMLVKFPPFELNSDEVCILDHEWVLSGEPPSCSVWERSE